MTFQEKARHVLQQSDAQEKANTLWVMRGSSLLPDDVMEAVKSLTQDRSVVRMYIPFKYGEIRYLAMEVYSRAQFLLGRVEPLIFKNVIVPVKSEALDQLRKKADLPMSYSGPIASFTELRDLGLLDVADAIFERRDFDLDD